MARNSPASDEERSQPVTRRLAARIARALLAARLGIVWERVWPAIVPFVCVVGVFCIVSWLGLWPLLNPWLRLVLVGAFALVALASLYPMLGVRLPVGREAVTRVERASNLAHRPISTIRDTLSNTPSAEARALWAAHQRRTAEQIGRLSPGGLHTPISERDPYALRAVVGLLFVVAAMYAGDQRLERLQQAFLAPAAQVAAETRLDAWVSPPSYTARPPVLLTQNTGNQDTIVSVPAGSRLIVRSEDARDLALSWSPDEGTGETYAAESAESDARLAEMAIDLERTGMAEVRRGRYSVALWRFEVVPDAAPTIRLSREPEALPSGALRLSYEVGDDYGVIAATAGISALNAPDDANPLVPAPELQLTLPQLRARSGSAQTVKDLTSHPWAGAEVVAVLEARDDAGQSGLSEPVRFTLPSRTFREPLARALVEQRRNLALDRNAARGVWRALEMLAVAPEHFDMEVSVYLGLRSVAYRLRLAHDDDGLRSVLDMLWDMALFIEDGDLADVARDLRAAQEALQQALDENASDQEIARLVEELREALNRFMQEMARRAQDPGNVTELPNAENLRTVTPQDLDRMLDSIENMARSGARDEAQQLLSELRNMLESLQSGQMQQSAEQSQMSRSLEELADMIRRQQELMDQTFRLDQQGPQRSGQGQQGEQGQPGDRDQQGRMGQGPSGEQRQGGVRDGAEGELDGLARAQGELRQQLEEMLRRLQESGHNGQEQFGRAGDAMGNAEGSLGSGETGDAVQSQAQALDALRSGARQLADQLARSMGMQGANAPGQARTDPMGRPLRSQGPDLGTSVQVPDEIDAARARKILEELRRRLSDPARSRIERDYLERLLGR